MGYLLNSDTQLTTVVTAAFNFEKMLANIVRYKINILLLVFWYVYYQLCIENYAVSFPRKLLYWSRFVFTIRQTSSNKLIGCPHSTQL